MIFFCRITQAKGHQMELLETGDILPVHQTLVCLLDLINSHHEMIPFQSLRKGQKVLRVILHRE